MEDEREVRDAILLLVNACNDYQTRLLALTSALRALNKYPANIRAKMCECELQAEALNAYNDEEAKVEAQAKEVKSALEGSEPFLNALTKFASRHYRDSDSTLARPRVH